MLMRIYGLVQGGGGLVKISQTIWSVYDTSNSEIPSNDIYSLANDANGKTFIGTWGKGAASFDGNNWELFNAFNSAIPGTFITDILIDANDNKWICTSGLS